MRKSQNTEFKITMKKIFLFVALQLLMTSSFAVTVMGARSCGTWIEARKSGGISELASEAWIIGYLTGLSVESDKDILASTDANSIYLWTDKFCRDNPLDRLDKAGYYLFVELISKIRNK